MRVKHGWVGWHEREGVVGCGVDRKEKKRCGKFFAPGGFSQEKLETGGGILLFFLFLKCRGFGEVEDRGD